MKGRTRVFRGRDSIRSTNLSHRVVPLRTAVRRVICTVKKNAYTINKKRKTLRLDWRETGNSSLFPRSRWQGSSLNEGSPRNRLNFSQKKEEEEEDFAYSSMERWTIEESFVFDVASFRQRHLWTALNSTLWPKFQWRAQSCLPRGIAMPNNLLCRKYRHRLYRTKSSRRGD